MYERRPIISRTKTASVSVVRARVCVVSVCVCACRVQRGFPAAHPSGAPNDVISPTAAAVTPKRPRRGGAFTVATLPPSRFKNLHGARNVIAAAAAADDDDVIAGAGVVQQEMLRPKTRKTISQSRGKKKNPKRKTQKVVCALKVSRR